MPDVDIIIVTYNSYRRLYECLEGLRLYNENSKATPHILVVDNASRRPHELAQIAKEYGGAFKQVGYNSMYTHANMEGIKATDNEYILILNPDCIGREENWLDKLITDYETNEDTGILSVVMTRRNNEIVHAGASGWGEHIGCGEQDTGQYDTLREVPWVTGALHLIRRDLYEKVGGHRPEFKHIESDKYLCLDMQEKLKLKSYCSPTKFYHYWGKACE
tara:strand:- start:207 stop:863 length:657 start_codon:yes stop_codon:yes gene_type:complete